MLGVRVDVSGSLISWHFCTMLTTRLQCDVTRSKGFSEKFRGFKRKEENNFGS